MEILDCQRLFHISPGADPFTGMMTDPAAYGRKWVGFFEKFECFPVFSLSYQGNVALNADVGRAGGLTGGRTCF